MARNAQTFEFADSSPISSGKKHRRGRGYTPKSRKSKSSNGSGTSSSSSEHSSSRDNSYQSGSGRNSSAAASLSAQSHYLHRSAQTSQNYYTSDEWDNPDTSVRSNSKSNGGGGDNNKDDNSYTGSLTYSASSSVQSAESSEGSSFAGILKLVDNEGEGASEIKDFITKQSKAASGSDAGGNSMGTEDSAVAGWMQRVERRASLEQQQTASATNAKLNTNLLANANAQAKKKKNFANNKSYSMPESTMPTNSNVDLNYSKDDSSEEDQVFGIEFDENILETIAGLDEDISRQSQVPADHPFRNKDLFASPLSASSSSSSPGGSSRSSGHVTPPPNSRHKRTSTPPGATNISRTSSRHSKSSSDGSWDTPAPSSPPNGSAHSNSKPPHARSSPVSKTRRGKKKEEKTVESTDLSEAFYAKSWMCGFTDAFNFDGFDRFKE